MSAPRRRGSRGTGRGRQQPAVNYEDAWDGLVGYVAACLTAPDPGDIQRIADRIAELDPEAGAYLAERRGGEAP